MNTTTTPLSREEEEKAAVLAGKWDDAPSEQDIQDYLTGNLLTERPVKE